VRASLSSKHCLQPSHRPQFQRPLPQVSWISPHAGLPPMPE
jgi:hypothetical protein